MQRRVVDSNRRNGVRQGSVVTLRVTPNPGLRLFFFPHAGGSAASFRGWPAHLPMDAACYAIQLPGRGDRLREPPFTALTALVDNLAIEMQPWLQPPFVFFGHSMGALIAFELTRRLQAMRVPTPVHLFVSGRGTPDRRSTRRRLYDLPDEELIEEVDRLGGLPGSVRADAELMHLLLPTMRADFSVTQTYVFAPGPPLECPITALGGTHDPDVGIDQIAGWRDHTTRTFTMHVIEGDHFFVDSAMLRVCGILFKTLSRILQITA